MDREDDEYSEEENEKEPLCLQRITNFFWKNRTNKSVVPYTAEWDVIQESYKLNAMIEKKGEVRWW